jgi:hypothetical protein
MNLQDATTRVRRAIEVIAPEFELQPPLAFVELNEPVPGVFDVTLTDDDFLAPIHDVTVRHVLGAQIGTIRHEVIHARQPDHSRTRDPRPRVKSQSEQVLVARSAVRR